MARMAATCIVQNGTVGHIRSMGGQGICRQRVRYCDHPERRKTQRCKQRQAGEVTFCEEPWNGSILWLAERLMAGLAAFADCREGRLEAGVIRSLGHGHVGVIEVRASLFKAFGI